MLTDQQTAHSGGATTALRAARSRHAPVWFGSASRPLFGWVSAPSSSTCRGGVVLCPPLGAELFHTHRTFRFLAEKLAHAGFLALRFDYEATGDSAGSQDDPEQVASWLESVSRARAYLRELGASAVSVLGMRMGATLAAVEAARAPEPPRMLVLWDPCPTAMSFLRQEEALLTLSGEEPPGQLRDPAYHHTPGFQFSRAMDPALRELDIARIDPGRRLAERVLLVSRVEVPLPGPTLDRLEHETLVTIPALGQDRMLDVPTVDADTPAGTVKTVIGHLREAHEGLEDRFTTVSSGSPGSSAVLTVGPHTVRERTTRVGPGLAAIVTEPVGPAVRTTRPQPWVVLLNIASDFHIGPGRRWVELARSWAASGHRTIRLDLSGIGDSPTHPGQLEGRPYAPEWIDDLPAVVRELRADGSPVVIIGLCSGAYSAFETTLWTDVDAVFAVNPRLTLYPAARGTPMFTPRRRAAIVPPMPVTWVPAQRRGFAERLWRLLRQVAIWNAPAKILLRLGRTSTRLEILACPDDSREFTAVVAWRWPLRRLARTGRFHLVTDPALDHSLLTKTAQDHVAQAATRFLDNLGLEAPR